MKKLLCAIYMVCALNAFGEEAQTIPADMLRVTIPLYFGFQTGDIEDKALVPGLGVGLFEYGVTDWLNMQFLWTSGIHVDMNDGNTVFFPDVCLSVKALLIGEDAPMPPLRFMRLSTALGIKMPVLPTLYTVSENSREPDQRLYGSFLRAYCDLIPSKYFYFNFYFEGVFYPPQRSDNPAFKTEVVEHYLDLTGEIEACFQVPLQKEVTLKGGAFGRFFIAPWMNAADPDATNQFCLSVGTHFDVLIGGLKSPLEISIGYAAPILGRNINPVHRTSLTFRVYVLTNRPAGIENTAE